MRQIAFLMGAMMIAVPAMAEDDSGAPALRELINCIPASGISEFVAKFDGLDADKRDTVDMLFEAKLDVNDDGVLPTRIFLRDGEMEDDFALTADGTIADFRKIGKASKTTEFCLEDPTRIGTKKGGNEVRFGMSNNVHFLTNDGYHDLATLKEGLKDGKSHYKKMAPAAMRMLVPSLKYVMIEYENEETTAQFSAIKDGVPVEGLTHESFCGSVMIKVKDLEKLEAEGLKVMGGAYNLTPVPGVKTLERFAGCSEDENSEEKKE